MTKKASDSTKVLSRPEQLKRAPEKLSEELRKALVATKKKLHRVYVPLHGEAPEMVIEKAPRALKEVKEVEADVDREIKQQRSKLKEAKFKMTSHQAFTQLKDLLDNDVFEDKETNEEMVKELEEELVRTVARETVMQWVQEMLKIKTMCDEKTSTISKFLVAATKKNETEELRRSIARVKGMDVSDVDPKMPIKSVDITVMPEDAKKMMFHPVWLSRKLEREFGVIVDKPKNTHLKTGGCSLTGFVDDVDACAKKLADLDFSGKVSLILDGRQIAAVMGAAGNHAREIEDDCDVMIVSAGTQLDIHGTEAGVKKAMERIQKETSLEGVSTTAEGQSQVSEQVKCNNYVSRAILNEVNNVHGRIEKECGVVMSVAPSSEGEGVIMVRGPLGGVTKALLEVNSWVNRQMVRVVEADPDQVAWLFGGGQKKGMGEVRLYVKFSGLRREPGVSINQGNEGHENEIGIVVDLEHEEKAEEIVRQIQFEILPKTSWETDVLEVPRDYTRCWTESICKLVGEKAGGAELTFRRPEDRTQGSTLEIWGPEASREAVKQLVNKVYTPRELEVPVECLKPLVADRCRVITEIQSDAAVHIFFAKEDRKIYLYGLPESKELAEKMYKDFEDSIFEEISHLTIKAFELKWEEFGRMIGPKGRTISRIREESGVEDIRIDEHESRVVFTGTENSVDIAIQMAEEELSARKEVTVLQQSVDNKLGKGEDIEKKVGTKGSLLTSQAQGGWVSGGGAAESAPRDVDMENEELFPSLGAAPVAPKKKKMGRKKF